MFSFFSGSSNITKLDIAEFVDGAKDASSKEVKRIKSNDKPVTKFRKTPDSDILRKMKLKYGKNIAKF